MCTLNIVRLKIYFENEIDHPNLVNYLNWFAIYLIVSGMKNKFELIANEKIYFYEK